MPKIDLFFIIILLTIFATRDPAASFSNTVWGSWVIPWLYWIAGDPHCRGWNWSTPSLLEKIAGRKGMDCRKERKRYGCPLQKGWVALELLKFIIWREWRPCLAFIRDNSIWFKYMSTATHCDYYPLSLGGVVPHPGSSCFWCIMNVMKLLTHAKLQFGSVGIYW